MNWRAIPIAHWRGPCSARSAPEDLIGILMAQRMMDSPQPPLVFRDFWTGAYQAIDDCGTIGDNAGRGTHEAAVHRPRDRLQIVVRIFRIAQEVT